MSWEEDVRKYHHKGNRHERGIVASIALGIAAGVSAILGGGLLAGGIGALVGFGAVAAAGWGIASAIGSIFNPKTGQMDDPKNVSGTPEYAEAQGRAKEAQKKRRLQIADAGGTSLTSPMGLSSKAPTTQKTLLGA